MAHAWSSAESNYNRQIIAKQEDREFSLKITTNDEPDIFTFEQTNEKRKKDMMLFNVEKIDEIARKGIQESNNSSKTLNKITE
jgi:hypothetical protein